MRVYTALGFLLETPGLPSVGHQGKLNNNVMMC